MKALMLDIDGVIIHPMDGRSWRTNLERDLGISVAALQQHFFKPHWELIVTGQAELVECLGNALASIAPNVTPGQLMAYWFGNDARVDQQFLRDVAGFRSQGLRVFLATNQEHERTRYLMDVIGLREHVDGCYYSAALGCRKPHKAFFDTIQSRLGLSHADILLIDDAEENVAAAIAAGWAAEHWTPGKTLVDVVQGWLPGYQSNSGA